jgi:hypothetical protein
MFRRHKISLDRFRLPISGLTAAYQPFNGGSNNSSQPGFVYLWNGLWRFDAEAHPRAHFEIQIEDFIMKNLAVILLLALGLITVGCGSNRSTPGNINGTWNATLTDVNGVVTEFSFGTSLMVNGDGTLSVSNFTFNSSSPCFVSGETESGSFTLSGNFNGNVTGQLHYTVSSGSPAGNVLVLNGSANGNTISGTWTLIGGGGCSGSGNFTMTR